MNELLTLYLIPMVICVLYTWSTQIFKMAHIKRELSFLDDINLYQITPVANLFSAIIITIVCSVELLHLILHLPTHIKNLFKGKS
jgi:hypothetical protein